MAELLDLGLKFGDRLLKIQEADGHLAATLGVLGAPKRTGSARNAQARRPAPPRVSGPSPCRQLRPTAAACQTRVGAGAHSAGAEQVLELLEQLAGRPHLPLVAEAQRAGGASRPR